MENLGFIALGAVCLCTGGLIMGIAMILTVQWYTNHWAQPHHKFTKKNELNHHLTNSKTTSWLIMTEGPNRGMSILLEQPVMRIGRDTANEIRIDHPQISRFHARFTWENGRMHLEDIGSTNGTYINHTPLRGRILLKNGDVIGFGMVILVTFYQ